MKIVSQFPTAILPPVDKGKVVIKRNYHLSEQLDSKMEMHKYKNYQ